MKYKYIFKYYEKFRQIGNELFHAGLNNFHSGNLSVRENDDVLITATGSKLGFLEKDDLVCVDLNSDEIGRASCEVSVHRAIYKETQVNAIVHAHAPYSVVLSFDNDHFMPMDGEGKVYFPNGIKIVHVRQSVASEEVALEIPNVLKKDKAVIVAGHGIFAVGEDLIEAAKWISSIENSAHLVYLHRCMKGVIK